MGLFLPRCRTLQLPLLNLRSSSVRFRTCHALWKVEFTQIFTFWTEYIVSQFVSLLHHWRHLYLNYCISTLQHQRSFIYTKYILEHKCLFKFGWTTGKKAKNHWKTGSVQRRQIGSFTGVICHSAGCQLWSDQENGRSHGSDKARGLVRHRGNSLSMWQPPPQPPPLSCLHRHPCSRQAGREPKETLLWRTEFVLKILFAIAHSHCAFQDCCLQIYELLLLLLPTISAEKQREWLGKSEPLQHVHSLWMTEELPQWWSLFFWRWINLIFCTPMASSFGKTVKYIRTLSLTNFMINKLYRVK